MIPLIVLLSIFTMSLFLIKRFRGKLEFHFSARLALSVMLIFTAVGHFVYREGMTMMLPEFITKKTEVVLITGVLEITAAIGIHVPNLRKLTAWLLIVFFILILPANIHAAVNHVNYQTGAFDGNGLDYLWFRAPLQVFFIFWTYVSVLKFKKNN